MDYELETEVRGLKQDLGNIAKAVKEYHGENTREFGGIRIRLDELEQKGARRPIPDSYFAGGAGRGSPGAIVVASEDYQAILAKQARHDLDPDRLDVCRDYVDAGRAGLGSGLGAAGLPPGPGAATAAQDDDP